MLDLAAVLFDERPMPIRRDLGMEPTPTVGRIVHHVALSPTGAVCQAAVVTEAGRPRIGLAVLDPSVSFVRFVTLATGGCLPGQPGEPGTWHWPERA